MVPKYAVVLLWIAWLLSWGAAASWTKHSVATAGFKREWLYRVLQGSGFLLMFVALGQPTSFDPLPPFRKAVLALSFAQVWDLPAWALWGATALAALGFAFAWWARVHLAELWSSGVARKEGHTVIDTGPYAFVRHPIYTGMLLGAIALVAISGRTIGIAGFVMFAVGLFLKARLEEQFLRAELGTDAYAAYAKRVPMLVPGLPG